MNQYTNRTVPGAVDIIGLVHATNTITVNGQTPYRNGEYYRYELSINNSSSAAYPAVTNQAGGGLPAVIGNIFLAHTNETFGYDLDGNQTNDGRWVITWDAENRPTRMESLSTGPIDSQRRLDYSYDYQGRLMQRIVSTNDGFGFVAHATNKFLYDGMNQLAELDGGNNLVRCYMWGSDLSGTRQGAGGVGGLLSVRIVTNGVHFVAYDGNGNVAGLVAAADGKTSARYEYGPFGEAIRVSGLVGKANPIRFSSKYADEETGFLYYGFGRFLDPSIGRWLSRDPIGEEPLYSLNLNDAVNRIDPDGRQSWMINGYYQGGQFVYQPPPWAGLSVNPGPLMPTPSLLLSLWDWNYPLKNALNPITESSDLVWFKTNPNGKEAMQKASEYFTKQIRKHSLCDRKTLSIPDFNSHTQPAYYKLLLIKKEQQGAVLNEWPIPQSVVWSVSVLGSVQWRMTKFNIVRNGSEIRWNAEISIVDKLGWGPENWTLPYEQMGPMDYILTEFVGGTREFVRGRFTLTGSGCCYEP